MQIDTGIQTQQTKMTDKTVVIIHLGKQTVFTRPLKHNASHALITHRESGQLAGGPRGAASYMTRVARRHTETIEK